MTLLEQETYPGREAHLKRVDVPVRRVGVVVEDEGEAPEPLRIDVDGRVAAGDLGEVRRYRVHAVVHAEEVGVEADALRLRARKAC